MLVKSSVEQVSMCSYSLFPNGTSTALPTGKYAVFLYLTFIFEAGPHHVAQGIVHYTSLGLKKTSH